MYVPISRNSIGKILIGKNRPSIGAITKLPVTTRFETKPDNEIICSVN